MGTPSHTPPTRDERERAYRLAAAADVDFRTAVRALREGAEAIRVTSTRERIVAALAALETSPPSAA